jgi:hypothetical protein
MFPKFKLIGITPDRGANSKELSASLNLSASPADKWRNSKAKKNGGGGGEKET